MSSFKLQSVDFARIAKSLAHPAFHLEGTCIGSLIRNQRGKPLQQVNFSDKLLHPLARTQRFRELLKRLEKDDIIRAKVPPRVDANYYTAHLGLHSILAQNRMVVVVEDSSQLEAVAASITSHCLDALANHDYKDNLKFLLNCAIKKTALPEANQEARYQWVTNLTSLLAAEQKATQQIVASGASDHVEHIHRIHQRLKSFTKKIDHELDKKFGTEVDVANKRVAPKFLHETSPEQISQLVAFLTFMNKSTNDEAAMRVLADFVRYRGFLRENDFDYVYDALSIPDDPNGALSAMRQLFAELAKLLTEVPTSFKDLEKVVGERHQQDRVLKFIAEYLLEEFPLKANVFARLGKKVSGSNRTFEIIKVLHRAVENQIALLELLSNVPVGVKVQMQELHLALKKLHKEPIPLCLEISRFLLESRIEQVGEGNDAAAEINRKNNPSIQECLVEISRLQDLKAHELGMILYERLASWVKSRDVEAIINAKASLFRSDEVVVKDLQLQEALFSQALIWVVHVDALPLVVPCLSEQIDLCVFYGGHAHVADAVSAAFRSKRLVVIQDDGSDGEPRGPRYPEALLALAPEQRPADAAKPDAAALFHYLRAGRHPRITLNDCFGNFRDINGYINRHVYHDEIMYYHWDRSGTTVDAQYLSEDSKPLGLVKFFERISKSCESLPPDHTSGICIFGEQARAAFDKEHASFVARFPFLETMLTNNQLLATPGIDDIYYYWPADISADTIYSEADKFHQAQKRLGRLMSKPDKSAHHFIDGRLNTSGDCPSIFKYLAEMVQETATRKAPRPQVKRHESRSQGRDRPTRRSSGDLIQAMLSELMADSLPIDGLANPEFRVYTGLAAGLKHFRIDLLVSGPAAEVSGLGIIDLSWFSEPSFTAQDVIDSYLVLKRTLPAFDPVFCFMHELGSENTRVHKMIKGKLAELLDGGHDSLAQVK